MFSRYYFSAPSGEKRYLCDSCDRTYSNRSSLKRHMNYECGKLPAFPCTLCSYATKRKTSLASHYYRKHVGEDGALPPPHEPDYIVPE
ncbi:gastrula zinc finger protein xFG20-1-like [Diaphorina citri]|uniref:Gastrula zinc finger protein xFG20-1-like n=1 Tax=Diaphorina citri TaxID=121845 RepID=A0A3Q0IU41_DIACI|nr:gastrula zinc finger protein xFG20-1-like [Diaphorina citri]